MATGTIKTNAPVELLAKTASGLSTSQSVSNRKILTLADDISNYRLVQVIMYSTFDSVEREQSELLIVPLYDDKDVTISIFSDNNTSYYCSTLVKLSDASLIVRRAFFSNFSSPSFRVIGIP